MEPTDDERTIGAAEMQTHTGRAFPLLNPSADNIDIVDIAHSLALQCRYNGHTSAFYSVAQHSYVVSYMVAPQNSLWGLLHDAAEAYIGDMPAPWKWSTMMGAKYQEHERQIMRAICERFNLPKHEPRAVKRADLRIWFREKELFMPGRTRWTELEGVPPDPQARLLLADAWGWREAEARFLTRFHELEFLRTQKR